CIACSPSPTTCRLFGIRKCSKASLVMRTSPGSSSTSRTSTSASPPRSVMRCLLNVSGRDRQREIEFGPLMIFSVEPDSAAVMFDDLAAHGQADAGSRVLGPVMQSLEDDEDAVRELGLDSDPVVGHGEEPVVIAAGRGDPDHWRLLPAEFDGVADEVLEQRG